LTASGFVAIKHVDKETELLLYYYYYYYYYYYCLEEETNVGR